MTIKDKIIKIMGDDISFSIEGALNINHLENKGINPASVIKLSVLYAALKASDNNELKLDQIVNYSAVDLVPGSGILKDLSINQMTVIDLLTLMIVLSDNSATNILMDFLDIDNIQNKINDLGLINTQVNRKLYHMIPGVFNLSCTSDSNRLLKAFDSDELSIESSEIALDILSRQQYSDFFEGLYICGNCTEIFEGNHCNCGASKGDIEPIPIEFFSKSGQISGHVHDSAILRHNDKTLYITLFTYNQSNNSTTKYNFSKVGKILLDILKE